MCRVLATSKLVSITVSAFSARRPVLYVKALTIHTRYSLIVTYCARPRGSGQWSQGNGRYGHLMSLAYYSPVLARGAQLPLYALAEGLSIQALLARTLIVLHKMSVDAALYPSSPLSPPWPSLSILTLLPMLDSALSLFF